MRVGGAGGLEEPWDRQVLSRGARTKPASCSCGAKPWDAIHCLYYMVPGIRYRTRTCGTSEVPRGTTRVLPVSFFLVSRPTCVTTVLARTGDYWHYSSSRSNASRSHSKQSNTSSRCFVCVNVAVGATCVPCFDDAPIIQTLATAVLLYVQHRYAISAAST